MSSQMENKLHSKIQSQQFKYLNLQLVVRLNLHTSTSLS